MAACDDDSKTQLLHSTPLPRKGWFHCRKKQRLSRRWLLPLGAVILLCCTLYNGLLYTAVTASLFAKAPCSTLCTEGACDVCIKSPRHEALRTFWRRFNWSWKAGHQVSQGNLAFHDILADGPVSLRLWKHFHSGDAWSFDAWVFVERTFEERKAATIVAVGPFKLQLVMPAIPTLVVQQDELHSVSKYSIVNNARGNCGNLELKYLKTKTTEEAAEKCSQLAGCVVFTRSRSTGDTVFGKDYYSSDDRDTDFIAARREEVGSAYNYTQSLAPGIWNHVVATYSARSKLVHIYVNGLLSSKYTAAQRPLPFQTQRADVGHSLHDAWQPPFPGRVGNLRVWKRELSVVDIHHSMYTACHPSRERGLLLDTGAAGKPLNPFPNAHFGGQQWRRGFPSPHKGWRIEDTPHQVSRTEGVAVVVPMESWEPAVAQRLSAALLDSSGCDACRLRILFSVLQPVPKASPPSLDHLPHRAHIDVVLPAVDLSAHSWNQAVLRALGTPAAKTSQYVLLMSPRVVPAKRWLSALLNAVGSDKALAAAHGRVLSVTGDIQAYRQEFQRSFFAELDLEAPTPLEVFQGYPMHYKPAQVVHRLRRLDSASCNAFFFRTSLLDTIPEAFREELGPELSCADLILRLQSVSMHVVATPHSSFWQREGRADTFGLSLSAAWHKTFHKLWLERLSQLLQDRMVVNATTTWVMHCGGSMGIEAFNFMQAIEGLLPLRGQIQRGGIWCEHANVLEGTPTSFRDRITRLRRLSSYIPSDIMIHHKDYRQLSAWPWGPNGTTSYMIGRYMHEVDIMHSQWIDQIRHQLDEVWVPSKWQLQRLVQQGVPQDKVTVIPESIDTSLFDPDMWYPLPIPGRRRYAFLSVFKLEDRKGWKEMIRAYVTEFKGVKDVSLYIHTVTYPQLHYRRDLILVQMMRELKADGFDVNLYPGDPELPHIHVIGRHMSQLEMLRLYNSVDAFVLPSHGEGWGLPYMEAMAMGLPVIATNWSGMTEFMAPSHALLLDYTLEKTPSTAPWFRNTHWARPSIGHVQRHMRWLYTHPSQGKALGDRARKYIASHFDNSHVGNTILARIGKIKRQLALRPRAPRVLDHYMEEVAPDIHLCTKYAAWQPALGAAPRRAAGSPLHIAVVSTWPNRPCGVARFAFSSVQHLKQALPMGSTIEVFPIVEDTLLTQQTNDDAIALHIRQNNFADYKRAARYINENSFHVVVLQHEFGFWGGTFGSYAVCFCRMLLPAKVAVVHTLSDNLEDSQHSNLHHLSKAVQQVVVMSPATRNNMGAFHGVPPSVVSVIQHGVPRMELVDSNKVKPEFGWQGHFIVMTNGLLHPGKGIDLAITALPPVVHAHPDLLYVILGKAHPACGQICIDHMHFLKQRTKELGLTKHVVFHETFEADETLARMVQAADIYVIPYRDRITSNSGTLSLAMAAGKAIISTAFEHAQNVLPGRGILVEYESPQAITGALQELLSNQEKIKVLSNAAYSFAQDFSWDKVTADYIKLFDRMSA